MGGVRLDESVGRVNVNPRIEQSLSVWEDDGGALRPRTPQRFSSDAATGIGPLALPREANRNRRSPRSERDLPPKSPNLFVSR
jgi:hypothetical protein